jgi:long-subunit fatty acid transport protein
MNRERYAVLSVGLLRAMLLTVWLVFSLSRRSVWAQFGGINAEFAGGGARALALGGAFIALADDATAAEFNPAGLWQLRRPEIALQVIYRDEKRDVPLVVSSFQEGSAIFKEDRDQYFIPSFASFIYPSQHFAVGLSEFTNVYFDRKYRDPADGLRRHEKAENYAYGFSLTTGILDQLSVGCTLRYNQFRYRTEDPILGGRETFESDAPSANVGLIWRVLPRVRLGAVYKSTQEIEGDFAGLDVDTDLPDTFGFGLAVLPDERWRLVADVDRVRWSKFDPNPDDDFEKEDVWRYHAGLERYLGRWKGSAVFVRGGYFYEESNAFRYRGANPIIRDLASKTDPTHHYTAGFGFSRRDFQVDLALDVTDESGFSAIFSTVWYF